MLGSVKVFTSLYYLNLSRTIKISGRDKNHSPFYYNRPRGPLGGSRTPRGSIVQLCMYYVCISILYCPFIDYLRRSRRDKSRVNRKSRYLKSGYSATHYVLHFSSLLLARGYSYLMWIALLNLMILEFTLGGIIFHKVQKSPFLLQLGIENWPKTSWNFFFNKLILKITKLCTFMINKFR